MRNSINPRLVNLSDLATYLGTGISTAKKTGERANAKVILEKTPLYDLQKIDLYLDKRTTGGGLNEKAVSNSCQKELIEKLLDIKLAINARNFGEDPTSVTSELIGINRGLISIGDTLFDTLGSAKTGKALDSVSMLHEDLTSIATIFSDIAEGLNHDRN